MNAINARFLGVELYFEDLERARSFYAETLGLPIANEQAGHHAQFDTSAGFICLEKKGAESYPSSDKAVLFFAVPDLNAALHAVGERGIVHRAEQWAVLHDPEGHNVLLLQEGDSSR